MDNDLDVKHAFEGLFNTLSILTKYSVKNSVTQNDKDEIMVTLRNIDEVLQVFGLCVSNNESFLHQINLIVQKRSM